DLATAAGIPEAFLTAFLNLVVEGGVVPGASVLVHAGASGVGLAAIQVAKLGGARVAATTRTPEKLAALAAAGVDLAVDTSRAEVVAEIEGHWGRDAVDIVLDPIGATTLGGDIRALRAGQRMRITQTVAGTTRYRAGWHG